MPRATSLAACCQMATVNNRKSCRNAACNAVFRGRWAAVGPIELSTWNGPRAAHHEPLLSEVWFRRYQSCRPGCRIPPRWTGAPVPRSPRPALRRGRVMAGTGRRIRAVSAVGIKWISRHPYLPSHRVVLGLDPRTIGCLCRAGSGPRIKSEGGTVVGWERAQPSSLPAIHLAAVGEVGGPAQGGDAISDSDGRRSIIPGSTVPPACRAWAEGRVALGPRPGHGGNDR